MRTFLAVVGALFLAVIVLLVGLFGFGWSRTGPLKKEATLFVDDALQDILADWDGEALFNHAAPEFQAILTPDKLEELMMSGISQFGPMTNFRGSKCAIVRVAFETGSGETAEAECVAGASFARVDAEISAVAVKRGSAWRLSGFFVEQTGQGAALQRTAHAGSHALGVVEASAIGGFVAISARGREPIVAAAVGDARTSHVDR